MCTLTCLPGAFLGPRDGRLVRLRLVFSRDEQRTRPEGLSPGIYARRGIQVLMPRDGQAGGTWIAANDAGVVFALLNVNPQGDRHLHGPRVPVPIDGDNETGTAGWRAAPGPTNRGHTCAQRNCFRTRGAVIGHLTAASSAADAGARARTLPFAAFRPFRVLAFDVDARFVETIWTGERVRQRVGQLSGPLLRTSSGLGDALVVGPRRRLFVRMMRAASGGLAAAQDAFHRHQWPGRGELSVLMSRADARTVSITTVEVGADGVRMNYLRRCWPPRPDSPAAR